MSNKGVKDQSDDRSLAESHSDGNDNLPAVPWMVSIAP